MANHDWSAMTYLPAAPPQVATLTIAEVGVASHAGSAAGAFGGGALLALPLLLAAVLLRRHARR